MGEETNSIQEELEKVYNNPDIPIDGPCEEAKELGRIVAGLQD